MHYSALQCSCDCVYTDDGCYLPGGGAPTEDTGWAR